MHLHRSTTDGLGLRMVLFVVHASMLSMFFCAICGRIPSYLLAQHKPPVRELVQPCRGALQFDGPFHDRMMIGTAL